MKISIGGTESAGTFRETSGVDGATVNRDVTPDLRCPRGIGDIINPEAERNAILSGGIFGDLINAEDWPADQC